MSGITDTSGIKKYKDFIIEREGWETLRDPIKIKSSMITNINIDDEDPSDDDNIIPILDDSYLI